MSKDLVCGNNYDDERQVVLRLRHAQPLTAAEWLIHLEALIRVISKHADWILDEQCHSNNRNEDVSAALTGRLNRLEAADTEKDRIIAELLLRLAKLESKSGLQAKRLDKLFPRVTA